MSKSHHVHKLKRHTYATGNKVYFCVSADCNYKVGTELSLGKRNICWRCGSEFSLNEYSIRLAKPHCDNCHRRRVDAPHQIQRAIVHDEESLHERMAKLRLEDIEDSDL